MECRCEFLDSNGSYNSDDNIFNSFVQIPMLQGDTRMVDSFVINVVIHIFVFVLRVSICVLAVLLLILYNIFVTRSEKYYVRTIFQWIS